MNNWGPWPQDDNSAYEGSWEILAEEADDTFAGPSWSPSINSTFPEPLQWTDSNDALTEDTTAMKVDELHYAQEVPWTSTSNPMPTTVACADLVNDADTAQTLLSFNIGPVWPLQHLHTPSHGPERPCQHFLSSSPCQEILCQ